MSKNKSSNIKIILRGKLEEQRKYIPNLSPKINEYKNKYYSNNYSLKPTLTVSTRVCNPIYDKTCLGRFRIQIKIRKRLLSKPQTDRQDVRNSLLILKNIPRLSHTYAKLLMCKKDGWCPHPATQTRTIANNLCQKTNSLNTQLYFFAFRLYLQSLEFSIV